MPKLHSPATATAHTPVSPPNSHPPSPHAHLQAAASCGRNAPCGLPPAMPSNPLPHHSCCWARAPLPRHPANAHSLRVTLTSSARTRTRPETPNPKTGPVPRSPGAQLRLAPSGGCSLPMGDAHPLNPPRLIRSTKTGTRTKPQKQHSTKKQITQTHKDTGVRGGASAYPGQPATTLPPSLPPLPPHSPTPLQPLCCMQQRQEEIHVEAAVLRALMVTRHRRGPPIPEPPSPPTFNSAAAELHSPQPTAQRSRAAARLSVPRRRALPLGVGARLGSCRSGRHHRSPPPAGRGVHGAVGGGWGVRGGEDVGAGVVAWAAGLCRCEGQGQGRGLASVSPPHAFAHPPPSGEGELRVHAAGPMPHSPPPSPPLSPC
jgi:hypothetical protein